MGRNFENINPFDFFHSLRIVNGWAYSYLMASIGGSLAARRAGNTPKKIPIAEEITSVMITEKRLIDAGKNILTIRTMMMARISPSIPPKSESIKLSVKN